MNPQDPNVVRVELVAEALGELCHELVFVGGCAVSMLIDAPTAVASTIKITDSNVGAMKK